MENIKPTSTDIFKTCTISYDYDRPINIIGGFGGGGYVKKGALEFNELVRKVTNEYFNNDIDVKTFEKNISIKYPLNNPFVDNKIDIKNKDNNVISHNNVSGANQSKRLGILDITNNRFTSAKFTKNNDLIVPNETFEQFLERYKTRYDLDNFFKNITIPFTNWTNNNLGYFEEEIYEKLNYDETYSEWIGLPYLGSKENVTEPARYVWLRDIDKKYFISPNQYTLENSLIEDIKHYEGFNPFPKFDNKDRLIIGYGHVINIGETLGEVLITDEIYNKIKKVNTNEYKMIMIDEIEGETLLLNELNALKVQISTLLDNKMILPSMMSALLSLIRNVEIDNFMTSIQGRRIITAIRYNFMEYFIDNWMSFVNPYNSSVFVTDNNNTIISENKSQFFNDEDITSTQVILSEHIMNLETTQINETPNQVQDFRTTTTQFQDFRTSSDINTYRLDNGTGGISTELQTEQLEKLPDQFPQEQSKGDANCIFPNVKDKLENRRADEVQKAGTSPDNGGGAKAEEGNPETIVSRNPDGNSYNLQTGGQKFGSVGENVINGIENGFQKYKQELETQGYTPSVDQDFLYKTAAIESNYRTDVVSGTGAKGMFQFTGIAIDSVENATGVRIDPYNPTEAAWGAMVLADLNYDAFGSKLETQLGRDLKDSEFYIMHNLGAGGGNILIYDNQFNPNQKFSESNMTRYTSSYNEALTFVNNNTNATNSEVYNAYQNFYETGRKSR